MKLGEYKERCRELQEKNLRLEMEKKAAEENLADIHMSLKKQLVEQESEIGELFAVRSFVITHLSLRRF